VQLAAEDEPLWARGEQPQDGEGSDAADRETLATWYRAHSARLLRFLARRTGSREEARDILHDVFCRVAGKRTHARIERPEAYLTRTAVNLLKDRAKIASRRSAALHLPADENQLAGPDPIALLETRDVIARLEAAMLKLKPKTREIFMAHRLDGLTYAEIGERTGLSVKGVEKQMAKAIAQIDRFLHRL
jgi:RNA polymerase sigma-70 factor (ECF subfamily)